MRPYAKHCLMASLVLLTGAGICRAEPAPEANRIAGLIQQLGDKEYARREAARKELETVGAPALEALRKAASAKDPEIRRQPQTVMDRIHAAAAKKELPRWQGLWAGHEGQKVTISG